MNWVKKISVKNVSLLLSYLTISFYIIFGNALTFNLGNRMPVKVAEIFAFISCVILLIIHKKDVLKVGRENIKIIAWFVIAMIPMLMYNYSIGQIVYGLLYPARIIATLAVAIVVTNVFKKYEVSSEKVCKYFIYNYLIVCAIGFIQLIFFPVAYDFYDIFYNMGVYFSNPDPHVERLFGTYFDPNFLAACLIIPTILALDIFAKTGKKNYFVYVVIFITTIVLTVSRSGVAGLCMALFVYAICTLRKKDIKEKELLKNKVALRAFGIMIGTAVIFIFLTLFTNVRVFKRIIGSFEDDSTYARISDWANAADMMTDNDKDNTGLKDDDINILYGIRI